MTHSLAFFSEYSFNNRFAIAAALPVIFNRSETRALNESGSGIGDLTLQSKFGASLGNPSRTVTLQFGAGVTLPLSEGVTGVFTDERTFTTETVDLIASALSAMPLGKGWHLAAAAYTRQVFSYSDDKRKGDFYMASVRIASDLPRQRGQIHGRVIVVARSGDDEHGHRLPNTGGNWIFLAPGASLILHQGAGLRVRLLTEWEWPLRVYVRGTQLAEDWNIRAGVNLDLDLIK